METALFTEVNLPWFTTGLSYTFKGSLAPCRSSSTTGRREDQHAMLLETYLLFGDNGDHRERARLRKLIIRQGWSPRAGSAAGDRLHRHAGAGHPRLLHARRRSVRTRTLLARALNRIAKDETLHYAFYKDAVKAHLEVEPNFVEPWPGC